ncbi:hypothetical protein PQX77_004889 [Marasmius sp. AFHP31]|nr:hypothetical protein PQX77_004889 [Marasmius sp. AFHP31]
MAKRTPRANNTLYISEVDMLAAISLVAPFPDLHVVSMTMSAPSNPTMSLPDDARLVSLSSQVPHFDPVMGSESSARPWESSKVPVLRMFDSVIARARHHNATVMILQRSGAQDLRKGGYVGLFEDLGSPGSQFQYLSIVPENY